MKAGQAADVLVDVPDDVRLVHGVKVDSVDAPGQEVDDLLRRVGDARLLDRPAVIPVSVDETTNAVRHRRAAHRDHLVDLRGRRNRHDARDDGDRHAEGAGPVPEAAENVVVEKELTDQGVHAQVRLLLQAAQVLLEARGLQVLLRVASDENAETPAFPDEDDQIFQPTLPTITNAPPKSPAT